MVRYLIGAAAAALLFPAVAQAETCIGNCGTASPNGVVTAPPAFGPDYSYVSTDQGILGAGQIPGVVGVDGSEFITDAFTGAVGDVLSLYFNYVTSDGAGFADYAFAQLLRDGSSVGYLFTARTTPTGDTSPGNGLPDNISTLTPVTSTIQPGTAWAQLGLDSNECYQGPGNGCGNTGWISSAYTLDTAGSYTIRFGVTNTIDASYDSGLAFAGVTINNAPVGGVPEPTSWALMIGGFGMAGGALRRRKANTTVAFA